MAVRLDLKSHEADELQQLLLDFLYGGKIDVNKAIMIEILHRLEMAQVMQRGADYDEGLAMARDNSDT